MKFWKFEYGGETDLDRCVSEGSLPRTVVSLGMKNTDQDVAHRMREGDGVVIGQLVGDQAKIYAVGRLARAQTGTTPPSVRWAKTLNYRQPDERGGLIHWQTKTAFQISSEPARRYGLKELINYYVPGDA